MLTRTAVYEGTIKAGREEEFFRRVRDELYPYGGASRMSPPCGCSAPDRTTPMPARSR